VRPPVPTIGNSGDGAYAYQMNAPRAVAGRETGVIRELLTGARRIEWGTGLRGDRIQESRVVYSLLFPAKSGQP